jgi:tRNA(His) 5'-end guanylyltransferase
MEVSDSFRDRMKSYEKKYGFIFSEDLPIICRVDGRSFSNWTRSLDRPVDVDFANVMRNVAVSVMKEIQGCVLSYTESDEITFVLVKSCEVSDLFFGGNQQKLNSMIASMTTAYFNNYIAELREKNIEKWTKPLAFFDCRSFSNSS